LNDKIDDGWIEKYLGRNDAGPIEVLSRHLSGGDEEIPENLSGEPVF
jgi:hypothetical protein